MGQPTSLLHRTQVIPLVYPDGVDFRARSKRKPRILLHRDSGIRPRQQKVRAVGARASYILRVRAQQTQVGISQCVVAFGLAEIVGERSLKVGFRRTVWRR